MQTNEAEDRVSHVIAIRVQPALLASIDMAAAGEGLSRACVVRRAVLRDLRASTGEWRSVGPALLSPAGARDGPGATERDKRGFGRRPDDNH